MENIYVVLSFILAPIALYALNKCYEPQKYQVKIYLEHFESVEVVLSSEKLYENSYPSITELLKNENMIHRNYFVYKEGEAWVEVPMREVKRMEMKKIDRKGTKKWSLFHKKRNDTI